ncbi:MAG: sn-glycerol-1-phosphate dehydrogenase [Lentisphaeria bacterium]|nr:sn-glycerol-1-phosphate dehydrogenase [Lentisphaeria bacterium]NQZ67862.1 sn-glycerol-1-phosphate dehydrogenase [Lentisphaeria bacterium]
MKQYKQNELKKLCAEQSPGELLDSLCGSTIAKEKIAVESVYIDEGVSDAVGILANDYFGNSTRYAVVMDHNTRKTIGEKVLRQFPRAMDVELAPWSKWKQVTPHDHFVRLVTMLSKQCDVIVSVGSGTINDICKYASFNANKPYISFATAASVNGYSSTIAALIMNGLKSTLPAHAPKMILADTHVLANSPSIMSRSGYADLLSKSVSTADWKLAEIVRDTPFSESPSFIVNNAIDACTESVEGIVENDPEALKLLMQSLVLSGFAMTIAGSSAPASGGEHLISHYWDMQAYSEGKHPALHGLQVALGSLITSRLYELVRNTDPKEFRHSYKSINHKQQVHGDLWPSIRSEASKQMLNKVQTTERIIKIKNNWEPMWEEISPYLDDFATVKKRLEDANVPTDFKHYNLNWSDVHKSIKYSHDIRNRYSILHLASNLGLMDDLSNDVMKIFK